MKRYFFKLLISLSLFNTVSSQTSNIYQSIDTLFGALESKEVPGMAVAVVRDGRLQYQHHYGMANLKKGIPVDSLTEFWIASVTKQFTAAAIYLLESENKISSLNHIRKYIPELPSVFDSVTIEQLLHHTSGIRDGFVLTALSKKMESDYTNENVLKYLCMQKELNFNPGTRFEYNNSGYVLLALVIERVTSLSYPEFMKTNIFTPLGMHHTRVAGKYEVGEKMAEGYHSKDFSNKPGSFEEGHFTGNSYGSTGIVTTLSDLVKWEIFIHYPKRVKKLEIPGAAILKEGKFKTGERIAYAGGLEKFIYHNETVFEHFGADEGFKANMLYFPGYNLSIIGLSNNTTNNQLSGTLYSIAAMLLKKKIIPLSTSSTDSLLWEQTYYDSSGFPVYKHIKMYKDYARISETPGGFEQVFYNRKDTFLPGDPVPLTSLLITKKDMRIQDPYYGQSRTIPAITPPSNGNNLAPMAGKYYSDELETTYEIIHKQGSLFFELAPGLEFQLYPLTNNDFILEYAGPNYIRFTKKGFEFSREGIHKLSFKKI